MAHATKIYKECLSLIVRQKIVQRLLIMAAKFNPKEIHVYLIFQRLGEILETH